MSTLSRYILKQHLGPFFLGLSLIVFLLLLELVLQMMDRVLSKGLSIWVALQLFAYNMAWIVALAVPMAVLVAVLMAFGRLAADNEIMAAKACGIGFWRLLSPVLIAALVLTGTMVLFNDMVLPDFNHQARNLAANLKRRKAALVLKEKEGVFIRDLGKYSLLVRRVDEENNRLFGITVYDSNRPGPPRTLHAPSGSLAFFAEGEYLRLTLENGEFHQIEPDDPKRFIRGSFTRQVIHIEDPQRALSSYRSSYRSDREMDVAAMQQAVDEDLKERLVATGRLDSLIAAHITAVDTSADSSFADLEKQSAALKQRIQRHWQLDKSRTKRINSYLVEIHKKFSIPAACLVFVLVGAPLGVMVRRRGAAVSVGISLAFFLAYWIFLIGGEDLADRGFVGPAFSMWAPNIVFGLLGIVLLRTVAFDRPLLKQWRNNEKSP